MRFHQCCFFLLTIFAFNIAKAQDCKHISFTKGASYEMEHYDDKSKKTGTTKNNVKEVNVSDAKNVANIHSEHYDDKNEKKFEGDLKVVCENGNMLLDISDLVKNNPLANNSQMELKMESSLMGIPTNLSVGLALSDGNAKVKILDKKSGQKFATVNISIYNRKVEAKEKITTPAGTFECFKITSDIKMETAMDMGMELPTYVLKGVSYMSTDMLLFVKNETFDLAGDLMGYELLSKFLTK